MVQEYRLHQLWRVRSVFFVYFVQIDERKKNQKRKIGTKSKKEIRIYTYIRISIPLLLKKYIRIHIYFVYSKRIEPKTKICGILETIRKKSTLSFQGKVFGSDIPGQYSFFRR